MSRNTAISSRSLRWLVFGLCVLLVGIPFWQIPYAELQLPDAFLNAGLLVVCIAALALVLMRKAGIGQSVWLLGSVMPVVLMIRVLVESLAEPSRHNLWPLVLIISVLLGFTAAFVGALLGKLLGRLLAGRTRVT